MTLKQKIQQLKQTAVLFLTAWFFLSGGQFPTHTPWRSVESFRFSPWTGGDTDLWWVEARGAADHPQPVGQSLTVTHPVCCFHSDPQKPPEVLFAFSFKCKLFTSSSHLHPVQFFILYKTLAILTTPVRMCALPPAARKFPFAPLLECCSLAGFWLCLQFRSCY